MKFMPTATIAAALLGVSLGASFAADPMGNWHTEEAKATVRIAACGPALCGTIVSLKEANDPDTGKPKTDKNNKDTSKQSRPLLGVAIVLGMKAAGGDKWEGQVYNAEDGGIYTGSFTMSSANSAELKGCVMGGLLCKGQTWTRSN